MSKHNSYIHGIGTAVPDHRYSQEDLLSFMTANLSLSDEKQRFVEKIYRGSSIDYRHSVLGDFGRSPEDFSFFSKTEGLTPEPTTARRNAVYAEESNALAEAATKSVCSELGADTDGITHLITASCTGFAAPGFDVHLLDSVGLRRSIERYHLGFMGCFAAIPALRLADHICRSTPDAQVLVVNTEICTLHFNTASEADTLVINSLFADGASAALVSADPGLSEGRKVALSGFGTATLAEGHDEMAWIVGDHGFEMKLSAGVPRLLKTHAAPIFDTLLSSNGFGRDDVEHWAIHPGGRAILDKVCASLELPNERLEPSYQILKQYGNMSSATVMFVLERMIRECQPGPAVAAAFGPGLTVESACLEIA